MDELRTSAETCALDAQSLAAFSDMNLVGIKTKVHEVLKLIGREGIFSEYTVHDISHINKMLEMLHWIIPDDVQTALTPTDWLLNVLAIYFHDMGLLVTHGEFEARDSSGFHEYCQDTLFAGSDGIEYKSKVATLRGDADRFLYQEFVRAHHAERIGDWVRGRHTAHLGYAKDAVTQIDEILRPLPRVFREDLAKVCESHHLSDLGDTVKYRVAQPYGDSDEETANVQYAAILLRTADLLHITSDRTPSVAFRLIDPQDPVSQREWAKQAAVRRVRPQKGRDREGALSEKARKDTVEVFAEFEDSDGFFGLTSYLRYAASQLRQSNEWAQATAAEFDVPHRFPWRHIDDNGVTATGFSPERLSFTLDRGKILNLLTGHTLYNDTSVVIRELVQNAIDAARLQAHIEGRDASTMRVEVEWTNSRRELVVRDTGTGMTHSVIENNLLKAGSSRYQEEDFQKKYAAFSPISRFGIGVLSAFMIADSVEINTVTVEEDEARSLTLKSVQGRYLVKLLDKDVDSKVSRIGPHGTEFRLRLRESAEIPDVLNTLKRWVVVPRCDVRASVDGEAPIQIGSSGPKNAVEDALRDLGFELYAEGEPANGAIRVIEKTCGSVTTAFAVVWQAYFREWSFLSAQRLQSREAVEAAVGSCIEGIRVEETTAGFKDFAVVALSNACGSTAPKTNVARSGLEATAERTKMLRDIYDAYLQHVAEEAEALGSARRLSLTWAAQEAEMLMRPLVVGDMSRDQGPQPVEPRVLTSAIRGAPIVLVERGGTRELATAQDLTGEEEVWTVDSAFVRAAERLLREIPGATSMSSLGNAFGNSTFELPEGITLVGYEGDAPLYKAALESWQVHHLVIKRDQRRVDLAWRPTGPDAYWAPVFPRSEPRQGARGIYVATKGVQVDGRETEVAVRAHGTYYLFHDSALAIYLNELLPGLRGDQSMNYAREFMGECVAQYLSGTKPPDDITEFVERIAGRERTGRRRLFEGIVDLDALISALSSTPVTTFDTLAWARREML